MPDREKVIEGLSICRNNAKCMECPYIYDGRAKESCCENVLHMDAIELLKSDKTLIENQARMVNDLGTRLKEQEIKTYGKVYCIPAEAVAKDRNKVEQELFVDIAKTLMENGVLVIHSENTIPSVQVTYGWKLKGRSVK